MSENEIKEESEIFDDHPEVISLKANLNGMSKEVLKKTTDTLRTEVTTISSKITQLKKTREEHNSEARHYRNMRNNITGDKFSEVDKLRSDAAKEKELRDDCNVKIKTSKELREKLKAEVREAWAKVNSLRDKYYKMKDEVGVLPEEITNEIRELEWKQQTTSIDPEEDALITKRITELYEKAYTAHKIGYSSEELDKAIEQAKTLSEEHDQAHENVIMYHNEGQKHHERMLQLYKEIDELRVGGDNLHEKFSEARRAADLAHQRIVELYDKIKLNQYLMDLIYDEEMERRQKKSAELREERIKETKKKQTSSKRLTLDELKLLMGDDNEDSD